MTHSNSRLAAALAAVVVALSASASGQVQGAPPSGAKPPVGTGLIAGQIVDDTGRGIAGAAVMLSPRQNPSGGPTIRQVGVAADSQGRFYFGALPAGGYTMIVLVPGHTQPPFRPIELTDGAKVTDVKMTLLRLSSVSGRVLDDSGTPVVSVEMLLLTRQVNQGRPPVLVPTVRTRTNDRGEYRFSNVPEGEFLVCACLRGDPIPFDGHLLSTLAARPLELLGAAGRAVTAGSDAVSLEALKTLPITFYPAATLVSQAERVRVAASEEKTGVDITVAAVRAARVSGRIVGASSSVSAAQLRLRVMSDSPEAANITQIVPMLVQPDGRFDFANVPPGQYLLEVNFRPGARGGGPTGAALAFVGARASAMQPVQPQGQTMSGPPDPASAPLWAQEPVSVGDRDVAGLVVALSPTLTLTGRVTFSGSTPQPNAQTLQRTQLILTPVETGPALRAFLASLQPDGTFRVNGLLPGRYVLQASLGGAPWVTLKSVMAAGDDLTDAAINVEGDLDLNVTVSDTVLGTVSGRVGPAGTPDSDPSWLRIFPADRRFWPEPYAASRRFRMVTVAADGRFSLGNLPAGEYFVVPSARGGTEWMDMATLESMARTAERIRVNDGDKLIVEVRR